MDRLFSSEVQKHHGESQRNRRLAKVISLIFAIGLAAFCIGPSQVAAQTTAPSTAGEAQVQLVQPPGPGQSGPPITVTLKDALERASKNDPLYLGAVSDSKSAHEDRLQARNALLPSVSALTQYLGTQGNGVTPNGRFVTNDGVHVYRAWGVLHMDLSPATLMATGYHRAAAAEALANAKAEIARRGLTVAVTKYFYALVVSQRKYATAQQGLDQANHFLEITQAAERAGQSPHSDAVKAEIQYRLQQQAFDEARLTMEEARLTLAVLLFPTLNENFTVVDDLDSAQALPQFAEIQSMAEKGNPDLRSAVEALREADLDVSSARNSFLPTFTVETDYGIEANKFALKAIDAACVIGDPCSRAPLPKQGYFITASLNIPVWDWGTLRSKLHQAQYKAQQARVVLSQAQRLIMSNLYAAYDEATIARSAVEGSRRTSELAAESLRLINLRYQGGASTAFEVVDAQNTLTTARNAYDDAQVRYRAALASLQTFTGSF